MPKKPRVVRNFWIELTVDGKKEKIAAGPRSAGGGFQMTIKQRDRGEIASIPTVIVGRLDLFGALVLSVDIGGHIYLYRTKP